MQTLNLAIRDISPKEIDPARIFYADKPPIGRGAFGVVYVGKLDSPLGPKVAVKRIGFRHYSSRVDSFHDAIREIHAQCTLWHPHVLPLIGYSFSGLGGDALLVSPYLKTGSAAKYCRDHWPNLDIRTRLVSDVACGLAYLHGLLRPIIHGDLKADNILLTKSCRAVISDFGLSEISQGISPNAMNGTISFVSPELFGARHHSAASDVWALACTAVELLCDRYPYYRFNQTYKDIAWAIQNAELPFSKERLQWLRVHTSLEFTRLLEQCWWYDPNGRPSSLAFAMKAASLAFSESRASSQEAWMDTYYPEYRSGSDWEDRWFR